MAISIDDFRAALTSQSPREIVDRVLLTAVPHVFGENRSDYTAFRKQLAAGLQVSPDGIFIVGSAMTGFCLSPDNYPRRFGDESDVDVVVCDAEMFDRIWFQLLQWDHPNRYGGVYGLERDTVVKWRKDIYWGWVRPDKLMTPSLNRRRGLKSVQEIGSRWFETFKLVANHPPLFGREISGRLYRTLEHVIMYHADGIRRLPS